MRVASKEVFEKALHLNTQAIGTLSEAELQYH